MSLIYSALAEIDAQAQAQPSTPAPTPLPLPQRRSRLAAMIAVAGVTVFAVGAGVYLWAGRTQPAAPPVAAIANAAPAAVVTAPAPASRAPVPDVSGVHTPSASVITAPTPLSSASVTTVPTSSTVDALAPVAGDVASLAMADAVHGANAAGRAPYASPAPAPAVAADPVREERVRVIDSRVQAALPPAAEVTPIGNPSVPAQAPAPPAPAAAAAAGPMAQPPVTSAAATAAPYLGSDNFVKVGKQPEVDSDEGVANQIAAFNAAMGSKDRAGARDALASLQRRLPAQSMTMLRMQAWYAVESGDDVAALALYQRILERLPGDVNAGINVALIDWRADRRHAAQSRIGELHTRHPDQMLVTRQWQAMQDAD